MLAVAGLLGGPAVDTGGVCPIRGGAPTPPECGGVGRCWPSLETSDAVTDSCRLDFMRGMEVSGPSRWPGDDVMRRLLGGGVADIALCAPTSRTTLLGLAV